MRPLSVKKTRWREEAFLYDEKQLMIDRNEDKVYAKYSLDITDIKVGSKLHGWIRFRNND